MIDSRGRAAGDCRAWEPLLTPYVDGEVAAGDCARVEQHLESCACCRDLVGRERAARDAVQARGAGLRPCAPEHLKARCAAQAAVRSAAARPPVYRRWVPVSLAATVLLAVAAVFGLGLTNKVEALAVQTTVDHVKCTRLTPPDAADPLAAAHRWQARFGWPLRVPPSGGQPGLQFRGVRRCAVTDGRVAHLIYSWMGEPLSVYVLPERTLGDATEFVRRFRHQSVLWSQNDRTYIIVTPRPRDAALDGLVAYVRAAAY